MENSATLILIHEGPPLPTYAMDCVRQIRLFNPDIAIFFLVDSHNMQHHVFADNLNVQFVDVDKEVPQHPIAELFAFRARHLCRTFRDGFWYWTTKRFATLLRFVAFKRLSNVFHIEYDNLVYTSLPHISSEINRVAKERGTCMAGVVDSDSQGVGSIVYFSDLFAVQKFVRFLIVLGSSYSNDMEAIAKYRASAGASFLCLPVLPRSYCTQLVPTLQSNMYLYEESDRISHLFDGRAVGQFLDGVDRRNDASSTCGFDNPQCAFRTSQLPEIEFVEDERGLLRPMLLGCPIANLHIHSKQLHRWMSDSTVLRRRYSKRSSSDQEDCSTLQEQTEQ